MGIQSFESLIQGISIELRRPVRARGGVIDFSPPFSVVETPTSVSRASSSFHWWPHTGITGPHRDPGATPMDGKPLPGWYRP